jgi:hypothetical protein
MSNQDPIALTFKGPHKTWWYGGSVVVVLVGLLVANGSGSDNLDLDVKRGNIFDRADDGQVLIVTNVGQKPITINKVVVNGRTDCWTNGPTFPVEFNIGERHMMSSNCRIIRVEINASNGSETYEFGG